MARLGLALTVALAFALGCRQQQSSAPPLRSLAPAKLAPLAPVTGGGGQGSRDDAYRVEPAPVYGAALPAGAQRLALRGMAAGALPSGLKPGAPVLLVPDEDTYLAQVAPLLAALDDARAEVWLQQPSAPVAYRLTLRDEPAFGAWLDEPRPGKVRVVQRADGLELQTNVGKLPGMDPNGPSVPLRAGQLDIATLRRGLVRLKGRFKSDELCVVPTWGTELAKVAAVLSGAFVAPEQPVFSQLCLVYPRPRPQPKSEAKPQLQDAGRG